MRRQSLSVFFVLVLVSLLAIVGCTGDQQQTSGETATTGAAEAEGTEEGKEEGAEELQPSPGPILIVRPNPGPSPSGWRIDDPDNPGEVDATFGDSLKINSEYMGFGFFGVEAVLEKGGSGTFTKAVIEFQPRDDDWNPVGDPVTITLKVTVDPDDPDKRHVSWTYDTSVVDYCNDCNDLPDEFKGSIVKILATGTDTQGVGFENEEANSVQLGKNPGS
jgi:hypothetical protein